MAIASVLLLAGLVAWPTAHPQADAGDRPGSVGAGESAAVETNSPDAPRLHAAEAIAEAAAAEPSAPSGPTPSGDAAVEDDEEPGDDHAPTIAPLALDHPTASTLWPEAPPLPPTRALDGVVLRSASDRRADLVVVVSIDGLRPDAIGAGQRNFARLREEGVTATNAQTIQRSLTLPSHAAMLSGVDVDQHGLDFNGFRPAFGPIRFPSTMRIARGAGLATAMFVGKNKLLHLVEEQGAERFVLAGRQCASVARRASAYLRTAPAGLVFVHFADPDSAGHRRGWMSGRYHTAVASADECVGTVLDALAARGHLERTLLIVTADHGGHGRSHGSGTGVDRHIPWFAWGGLAARGIAIQRPISTMDTAATALAALGLPSAHGMVGQPVRELFERRERARAGRTSRRAH